MPEWLTQNYYGNPASEWLLAGGTVVAAVLAGRAAYWLFSRVLKRLASKSETQLDDILVDMLEEPAVLAIVLGGTWLAAQRLRLPEGLSELVGHALQLALILCAGWLIARLLDKLYEVYLVPLAAKTETDLDDQLLPVLRRGTKLVIWTVAIIVGLNNAGYDVGAMIAGLGIGGIALAMAGRDTIANMFGGLTVFVDQPFTLHDRVRVAGFDGMIREIGLRSTRLETLEGRIVTLPNAMFTDSPVENVSLEPSRKLVLTLGLTYDTSPARLRAAMTTCAEIADTLEGLEEERQISISDLGAYSIDLRFVVFIRKDADVLETQTAARLAVLERFAAQGLELAFPTQQLLVTGSEIEAPSRKPCAPIGRAASSLGRRSS